MKAVSDQHARVLRRLGVARVVFPEKDMGRRVAERLMAPQILEHLELSPEYGIEEIVPPSDFLNRTIGELKFRTKYGVSVLAIRRTDGHGKEEMLVNPTRDDRILPNDLIVVIGHESDLKQLRD